MGSDNRNLIVKKCGDFLINFKKNNKKSKTYTFHCSFCETTYDQMETFVLHMEEFHVENFDDNNDEGTKDSVMIYETELENELRNEGVSKEIGNEILPAVKNVPLKTEADDLVPLCENNVQIKEEDDKLSDCEFLSIATEETWSVDGCNIDDNSSITEETWSADECDIDDNSIGTEETWSVDGCDIDDNISGRDRDESYLCNGQIEFSTDSDIKKRTRKCTKLTNVPEYLDINSEEKNLNIALLQLFEQNPYLWTNDRKKSKNEQLCQKGYESIAADINAKFSSDVSWVFVKNRINDMRFQCCDEMEKQYNGEKFQMPWYFEHMGYLKQNLKKLVHNRFYYKLSITIDETKLLIIIELYKKYEELWQVNNIYFGITAKRTEIYNRMVEELKSGYNIKTSLNHLKIYINHIHVIYSKDKEQELKSELKKRPFSPSSKHYEKLSFLKDSRGPFKCLYCNVIIKTFESYHIHVAQHTDAKPFKCLHCESQYTKFNNYMKHKKRHLNETSFPCDICGKCFNVKSQLDKHKPIHTYPCKICDATFRHSRNYKRHMVRHEKRFRFECHMCQQGFDSKYVLKNHVKSHLNVRDNLCNICGKGFKSLQTLKNHKLLHDDKKRYNCYTCGKEYAQKTSLRVHQFRKHKRSTIGAETKRGKEEAMLD